MKTFGTTRRTVIRGAAALGAASLMGAGRLLAADAGAIKLGSLVPITGSGGPFGPGIRKGQEVVVNQVNAAGGLLGRKIELVGEDDQTNPEAAVRAARKLIDVDKVVAILGTWASADVTAIASLCWENKVMVICIGAADSITELPHQGYIARTQPSTRMQGEQFAKFAVAEGAKSFYLMMPQSPFAESTIKQITDYCTAHGIKIGSAIYDGKKTSFRSEVDVMVEAKPDMFMLGGYLADDSVLAKDVFRANYRGKIVGFAYGVAPQFVEAVGKEVAEGIYSIEPVADAKSTAYAKLQKLIGKDDLDIYICQGYDEANLAILAMAEAKEASGTAIRDNLRKIGDTAGITVDNAIDGLKLIAEGKHVNYLGASGPCKFAANGDVLESHFRINVVRNGKIELYKVT
ncbi:MAG: ABC transporter substrate-binding protein [Alphaproteobacteria bacterium]